MVAVVQAAIITQAGGTWSGSFGSSVTAGSSVVLLASAATSSGGVISSSAPTFAGSSVAGASSLWGFSEGATDRAYSGGWLMPNVAGGSAAVGLTVTNGDNFGSGATGTWGIEVSGLGASPAVVTPASAGGSSTAFSSGATGSATRAGIAVGSSVAFGITETLSGGGWTALTQMTSQFGTAGYQLLSSGTVTFAGTMSAGNWAAGAAIILATSGAHTATASLTVTPAFSAAPAHVHARTASLTVTPVLSAAPAHSQHGTASLTVTPVFSAAPSGGGGPVTVAASWPVVGVVPSGFSFPSPAARPLQVAVANTPGDWLFAVATWRQAEAGEGVTVSVADDAHNWWEPLGAPSGDSAAAGVTRCAVWAAPAARVANTSTGVTNIQVAVSGTALALAVRILDVSGMQPWMTMTPVVTNYALAATALSLSAAAPSAQALMIACAGSDNNSDTLGGPGAGWTSLTPVAGSNGVDHTADITLSSAWQVTSASAAAAWTSTGALDFSGVIAGVLVSAAAPSQPNPNWPVVITEIAPGAGAQTLPALLTWTPLSARALSLTVQQGRQYTLAQLMAGQGTVVIDNPDGALIPPGTGAFAGIDSGTPIRQRVIVPSAPSPYYVAFSGYLQRWPWAAPGDMLRGETQATLTDAWGYAAGLLNSMAREEMLLDGPYAAWPLDDPVGSAQGSNIAPGNSRPLTLTWSKYGAGGAAVAFGANSGALVGDSSAKITSASGSAGGSQGMYSQTLGGTSLNSNGYGAALVCADQNYPPISGGVTIECWFDNLTYSLSGPGFFFFSAATSGSLFTSVIGAYSTGQPVTLAPGGFTLPGGFTAGTVYYVIGASGQTFQLSATPGGSAITVTSSGAGTILVVTPWNAVIMSARSIRGPVAEVDVRSSDGALLLLYRTASGSTSTAVVDGSRDYRMSGLTFVSLAFNTSAWRVIVNAATFTGTFSSALPASFTELDFGGIQDRAVQGYAWSGYVALAAVYPLFLAPIRAWSHFGTAGGLAGEAACDRVERLLEYAGLTGRRWLGQQVITGEGDLTVSGQDIGGQGAATSASNIAASTVPAMLYVAPTGDVTYLSKYYTWNQPVRWTLGDNAAGGEIPFTIGQFATDYDNARVVNDIQITQLDTQTVTVPSGVTSGTTLGAVEAASEAQYGDQPYQVTGYLTADATSPYSAGGSEVDLANWIADVFRKPANRVQAVTVNAAANAANASSSRAWQFWAGASVGDMVQVSVRMPTAATSPLISLAARITQTNRAGQFSQDGTSATIACVLDFAPEYNALMCDDAVRGELNGQNVLSW
jgi:hypothetical protein